MIVKFKEKEYTGKFTFNSFLYLEDFDMAEMQEIQTKPFKALKICKELLFASLNYTPNKKVPMDVVTDIIEDTLENGDITQLLIDLTNELEDSNFFKNLQKK